MGTLFKTRFMQDTGLFKVWFFRQISLEGK